MPLNYITIAPCGDRNFINFVVFDFDKFLSPLIISPDDERDISAKDTVGSNKSFNGYTFQTSINRFPF